MIDASIRLRRAILLGDSVLVERIIKCNPRLLQNPDFHNQSNTSLHLAAGHGKALIASFLIDAGHEKSEVSRNASHETPLMLAARNGHVEVGRLLIHRFPRCVTMTNEAGLDALSIASQAPASTGLIPFLLSEPDYPASPHTQDQDGNTPLHHASASGSLKTLRILLSVGANPLAKNNYDWTPLAYSQTVAAEVYFKNLVAEFERRKIEEAKMSEERNRLKNGGVRLVDDESKLDESEDDEVIGDALRRHWSPLERKLPAAPLPRHEWGTPVQHSRTRSGSGD
ncbi:Hypothetical protein R9X50_00331500 [Acrodontium crateriforme]|uniref:Ankyrin n=1 Tax=Acrodontium crateriforme TaxID=150365 RepID=A0AAQ3R453_9PEZI|nr:Hypothetical protein R9X50_00331500 [Acrodontium crateriforme]